jgi:hypothetical protein
LDAVKHIRSNDVDTACTVCGRTLLLGERLVTYHRAEDAEAHVCELCIDQAELRGWVREGTGEPPPPAEPRRRGLLAGMLRRRRRKEGSPEPFDLELLPEDPRDAVEAGLELFNESSHRRTVCGIARTLGDPQVSVVQRSFRELVLTVAWDLSWYQYRIDMLDPQPVTLHHRGDELDELDTRFRQWNALADADGSVALAASRA